MSNCSRVLYSGFFLSNLDTNFKHRTTLSYYHQLNGLISIECPQTGLWFIRYFANAAENWTQPLAAGDDSCLTAAGDAVINMKVLTMSSIRSHRTSSAPNEKLWPLNCAVLCCCRLSVTVSLQLNFTESLPTKFKHYENRLVTYVRKTIRSLVLPASPQRWVFLSSYSTFVQSNYIFILCIIMINNKWKYLTQCLKLLWIYLSLLFWAVGSRGSVSGGGHLDRAQMYQTS